MLSAPAPPTPIALCEPLGGGTMVLKDGVHMILDLYYLVSVPQLF